jgi:hypothetical protein
MRDGDEDTSSAKRRPATRTGEYGRVGILTLRQRPPTPSSGWPAPWPPTYDAHGKNRPRRTDSPRPGSDADFPNLRPSTTTRPQHSVNRSR